jgi:FlaA1/EpsC-like NDP-sugar epimerase
MYEELFKQSENLLPTHHPKILKAQRSEVNSRFDVMMDGLVIAAQEFDDATARSLIRQLVPEFRQSLSIEDSNVTLLSTANGQQEKQPA